jgi:hypothetical protein
MGKLTPEQAKQFKDLQALADAPDDEDFDIEIWEGDKGARVPYSKGKGFLAKLGIDVGDPPAADDDAADGKAGKDAPPDDGKVRRFGRTVAGS